MTHSEPLFERCDHDRKNPYVMISREMAQDPTISPKAKGVLLYLLSLPPDWKIYHSQLQKGLNVGEDYINSAMNELIAEGYAERSRQRINGMYGPYTYKIREFKKCSPNRENQPGSSSPGNPAVQSLDLTNQISTNKGNVLTLPSSKENRKTKFPLKKDQVYIFDALKELGLECDDDTLFILIRNTPLPRLLDAIDHLKLEIEKGISFKKGRIAFFRHSLKPEFSLLNAAAQENKAFAKELKEKRWQSLKINAKYALCEVTKQEIPFALSSEEFQRLLLKVYNSMKGRQQDNK